MKKILIVEDNSDYREIMNLFITEMGYQATNAKNSKEAITLAETENTDLMFMDMDLPDATESRQPRRLNRIRKPLVFPSLRLPHGYQRYWRKRLRKWVSQPT